MVLNQKSAGVTSHQPDKADLPLVAVLMGTRNGGLFLQEQLDSIALQEGVNVELWVSDDGSSDRTLDVVTAFAANAAMPVHILNGPQRGFVANFLSLACKPEIAANYYAFSDQDDIWHPNKLRAAVDQLSASSPGLPALYMSRTRTMDMDGRIVGMSPLFMRPPSLKNALVQSIGGGNTIVFNAQTRSHLMHAGPDVPVPSHDWWTYLVATAVGGYVVYDPVPKIDYRQHPGNIVGENGSMMARVARLKILLGGRFRRWIDANLEALAALDQDLTPEARSVVDQFRTVRREGSMFARLAVLRRLGLYRQTGYGTISMAVAAILNKL